MGNGSGKYSKCDGYYKKRRKTDDLGGSNFNKDYCEYWKNDRKSGNREDNFAIERNEFAFSNSATFDSPLRNSRKNHSPSFSSPFDQPSNNFQVMQQPWKK